MAMRRMRRFRRRSRPFRRSTLRRSRFSGRKRSRFDGFAASTDVNTARINFKRKRFNPKRYRRQLWRASESAQKFRSNNIGTTLLANAASPQQGQVYWLACVPDAGGGARFWQVAGGLITNNDTPATTDFGGGDLFIRGGVCTLTISTALANTQAVKVIVWRARTTVNGNIPSNPYTVSQGWDPSLPDPALLATDPNRDVYKLYKAFGMMEVMLTPGQMFSRSFKLRSQKIDQDQWIGLRSRDFWIIYVQNPISVSAQALNAVASWNLAFTADRIA